MAHNDKHQEETAIDKMNAHLTETSTKIANNKKLIFIVIGVICAVAAFTLAYLFIYKNPHVEKSFEAYNSIETQGNLTEEETAAKYMEVADKYKSDDAGKLAALSAGEALYNQGKYEEAANYLKRFSSNDEVLNANVLVLTGDCYVNLNKYNEALEYYNEAVRKAGGNPQIVPRVLLKEANVYDAQKNYAKALECYESIKTAYPEFTPGNGIDIDGYIARENARLGK